MGRQKLHHARCRQSVISEMIKHSSGLGESRPCSGRPWVDQLAEPSTQKPDLDRARRNSIGHSSGNVLVLKLALVSEGPLGRPSSHNASGLGKGTTSSGRLSRQKYNYSRQTGAAYVAAENGAVSETRPVPGCECCDAVRCYWTALCTV